MAKKQQKTDAPQTTDERIEYFNQIEENLSNRVVNCQLRVHKLNRQIARLEGKCSDVHIFQRALGLTPDEAMQREAALKSTKAPPYDFVAAAIAEDRGND